VIVHGRAERTRGTTPRRAPLEEAATICADALISLRADERSVRVLEFSSRFNATGSTVQCDGAVWTDTGLITADGAIGAACSMPDVEHAVSLPTRVTVTLGIEPRGTQLTFSLYYQSAPSS
jgi:L-asparaginase / beta-aspartyl-peptidase